MIRIFVKRLLRQNGYCMKLCLLLLVGVAFTTSIWTSFRHPSQTFQERNIGTYQFSKGVIQSLKQAAPYEQSQKEKEIEKRLLENAKAYVLLYETIAEQRYQQFPAIYLKANDLQIERYQLGEEMIVPTSLYRTLPEFQQLQQLEAAFYHDMIETSENLTEYQVLKVSAIDGLLRMSGYWWSQGYTIMNLSYLFLLVPFFFSSGLLSKDKRRNNFFLSSHYQPQQYIKHLLTTLILHHSVIQTMLLVIILFPLSIQFGFTNPFAHAIMVWGNDGISLPLLVWFSIYLGMIVIISILMTLVSVIGELLFNQLTALLLVLASIISSQLLLQLPISPWNPFSYLDLARSLNGYGELLHGHVFSLDRFLISSLILFGILFFVIGGLLRSKSRRGLYV